MSNRIEKLRSLFKTEISNYWVTFQSDNIISITNIDVSKDLKNMTIWISVVGNTGSILEQLRKDIPNLSKYLSSRLSIRSIPFIKINIDSGIAYSSKINNILEEINNTSNQC